MVFLIGFLRGDGEYYNDHGDHKINLFEWRNNTHSSDTV